MNLSIDDLNAVGRGKLENDFQHVDRRDGGKTSRVDFGLGWMACAARFGLWTVFTEPAARRLKGER